MNRRFFFFPTLPFFLASLALTGGCKVRYRHDVEAPGTPANYNYSAGGYMRYDGYDDVAGDLEVASRDFEKPGSGVRVRLTGAIHIGDIEYYRTLQKECLDPADVVLFEGVKYEGGEAPPDLGGLYSAIGQILGIGFQKDGIDYRAKNFVHCDITVKPGDPLAKTVDAAQLNQAVKMIGPLASMKAMLAQGDAARETEDALKHQMVTVMAAQMGGGEGDEKAAEESIRSKMGDEGVPDPLKQRAEKAVQALKKVAPAMPELGGMSEDMKREILEKRNRYVLDRLKERLDAADPSKPQTIAVFYGAAHMPGMQQELESWGYRAAGTTWLKAWRMNSAGKPVVAGREGATAEKPAARPAGKKREPVLY